VNCHIGKGGKFKFFSPSQESLLYCTGNVEMVDNYDLSSHQENIIHPSLDSIKYRCNSKLDLQKYPQIILPEPYLKLLEGNHIWICNEIDLSTTEMLVNINSPIDSDKYYIHPYIIDLVLYLIPILSCINSGNENNNDYQTTSRIIINYIQSLITSKQMHYSKSSSYWCRLQLFENDSKKVVNLTIFNELESVIMQIQGAEIYSHSNLLPATGMYEIIWKDTPLLPYYKPKSPEAIILSVLGFSLQEDLLNNLAKALDVQLLTTIKEILQKFYKK
jgi:hypothetical protein